MSSSRNMFCAMRMTPPMARPVRDAAMPSPMKGELRGNGGLKINPLAPSWLAKLRCDILQYQGNQVLGKWAHLWESLWPRDIHRIMENTIMPAEKFSTSEAYAEGVPA